MRYKGRSKVRNQKGAGHIVDFGCVFCAMVIAILLPAVNVLTFSFGALAVYSATHTAATKAADTFDYKQAANTVSKSASDLASSPIARFCHIQVPKTKKGMQLTTLVTDIKVRDVVLRTDEAPKLTKIDPSIHLCQYAVRSAFEIKPMIDLSGVPIIGQVPIIASPFELSCTVERTVEHPEGLIKQELLEY